MLGLDRVDLDELCAALEDNAPEHEWFLDALTGEFEFRSVPGRLSRGLGRRRARAGDVRSCGCATASWCARAKKECRSVD